MGDLIANFSHKQAGQEQH